MTVNPFKFEDVVRKGAAVLIKYSMQQNSYTCTIQELMFRIKNLREQHKLDDTELAQELRALVEVKKEIAKDFWPDENEELI
jgi:hypothetical protein